MLYNSTFNLKKLIVATLFCTLLSITSRGQIVAGFYGDWHPQADINKVQFNKLTDVFYAFIKSDNNGNVSTTTAGAATTVLQPMVTKAHAVGTRAHVSLGGANNSSNLGIVINNTASRNNLVNSIKNFVQTYNLDGFNMDWEFPSAGDAANLAQFMVDMKAALNNLEGVMGKELYLSCAVGPLLWNTDGINSTFIAQCDYIYVMAFDAQGNCCVCEPNHSGMNVAKWSIEKWTNVGLPWASCGGSTAAKNAPASKIVLAIPFYSNSHAKYKDFTAFGNAADYYNDADGNFGGQLYNSRPMIEQKINMIMNTYGGAGVWCWELHDDRDDQYALLNAMWNGMQPYFCQPPGAAGTITGNNSVCAGAAGITYSIPAVTNATGYTWTVPSGATITSGQNTRTITVTFGSSGGNVTVTPKNSCGNGTASSRSITINNVPPTPGAITGPTSVCPNQTGVNYSINSVAGATGYVWTLPSGATITSGNNTRNITVSFGGSTGTISVRASNGCGNSTSASNLNVSSSSGAANAGAITGSTTVCATSTGNVYSISPVSGAAGYNWTVPTGALITSGANTNSITVTFGTAGGNISVTPTSSCGNGNPSSRTITVNSAPGAAGAITGSTSICANGTATYTISPVSGATGYTWTLPSGATITSGNNTTSINVSFGSASGNVTVTPTNGTCTGTSKSLAVTVNNVPSTPGAITGNASVCPNTAGIAYSVATVPGAASYVWTYSGTNATITGTGNNITINFAANATSGNLTVAATNSCGTSSTSSKALTVGTGLSVTGATRCGSGSATLTINSPGGPYLWFTNPTGGSSIHTGTSYTTNVSSSTTYYVEQSSVTSGQVGMTSAPSTDEQVYDATLASRVFPVSANTMNFSTSQPNVTINSVDIYTGAGSQSYLNNFWITIENSGGTVLFTSTKYTIPASWPTANPKFKTVSINHLLPTAGNYRMRIYCDPQGDAWGQVARGQTMPVSDGSNTVTLQSGYNCFTNLKFQYGSSGSACGRTPIVATVNSPANAGLTVTAVSPICSGTNGQVSVQASQSGVSYQPYIGGTVAGTAVTGTGGNINLTVNSANLSAGSNTITVKAISAGCGTVDLTLKPAIQVNPGGAPTITFNNVSKTFGDAPFSMTATSNSTGALTYSLVSSTPSGIVTVAANGQVTITGAGTATIKVDQTASGCHTTGSATSTLTINKANRTVSITSGNSGSVGGTINLTHSVSAGGGAASWTVANATGTATLSGTTLNLTGAGTVTVTVTVAADANYNSTTANQTITIGSAPSPTITFTDITKTYGDAVFTLSATSNSSGAMTYSLVSSTPSGIVTVASNGQVTITGAGTATVKVDQAAAGAYGAGSATATLTINKANRTVSITSANTGNVGGTINLTHSVSAGTGAATYTVANATGTATLSGTTLSLTGAGTVTITVTVAADANYNSATANQTITIEAAPSPTITFNNIIKTYGEVPITLSATSNSSGAMTYSLVSSIPSGIVTVASNGQVTILGAGTATVKVDQAAAGPYGAGSATATITINKANRTVSITSVNSGSVGGTINLTHSVSAGTGAATWSVANGTGTATISGTTLSLSGAGTVTVTVTVAADANYNSTTANQTITIGAAPSPTITFNNIIKTYGEAPFTLSATSNSSGAMTYSLVSSIPSGIVTVASNGQVTILGAGTATVKVDQAAAGPYGAGSATATITINKANRTVSITSVISGSVGGTINLTHSVSAGTGAATWSVTNGTGTATLSGTTLSLTGAGTVTVTVTVAADANYNSTTANQTITIGAAPAPTITFNNITKTYGDAAFTLSATSNSSGAMTYSLVSSTPSGIVTVASNGQVTITGAGTATVKVDQAAAGAFGAGSTTATITINKANRTVNITSANHGFTNNTIALTYSVSNGDGVATWSVTNGSGAANVSGSTLNLTAAGNVTVSVTIAADANYNSASANQTITIYQSQTTQPGDFTEFTNPVHQGDVGVVYTIPNVAGTTYTWTYTNGSGVTIHGTGNSVSLDFSSTATSGTLTVVADDGSGPSIPRSVVITVLPAITGVEDISITSVNVYPNPFALTSNITFDLPTSSEVSVDVYNMLGIKVASIVESQMLPSGNHMYEITDLANGTYLVRLVIGAQSKDVLIVKQQ